MWKMSNPFPRLKALVRKPTARGPAKDVQTTQERPIPLKGFGPQVAMRLHRAQRTAALAGRDPED